HEPAAAEYRKQTHFHRGEKHLGVPETKGSLQNGRWIESIHKLRLHLCAFGFQKQCFVRKLNDSGFRSLFPRHRALRCAAYSQMLSKETKACYLHVGNT